MAIARAQLRRAIRRWRLGAGAKFAQLERGGRSGAPGRPSYAEEAIACAAWLAATARALGVPAVLTEEDPERNGSTAARILAAAGPDASPFTKPVFGLTACPDIMAAIESTGRKTAVPAGVELVHCKGIYDEWVRTLGAALTFEPEHPELAAPPGFWI